MGDYLIRWLAPLAMLAPLAATPAAAQQTRPSIADTFSLGRGGDTLCKVQWRAGDQAASGIFDRAYSILCRDAAAPVGRLYALRGSSEEVASRLDARREDGISCGGPSDVSIEGTPAQLRACATREGIAYLVLTMRQGSTVYAAEGFAGYRSALELGVRSLAADRVIDAPLTVATTGVGDAAAFARAQAGNLDPDRARVEGYRRNHGGSYAEAAEFFDTLLNLKSRASETDLTGEYMVSRALQLSNMGEFEAADALFAQALALPSADPVALRIRRNDMAMHLLNQGKTAEALEMLDRPVRSNPVTPGDIEIDPVTAKSLNDSTPLARQLGISANVTLTPAEKVTALEAQAQALRGAVLRQQGQFAPADAALRGATRGLDGIRGGTVISFAHLRAQILTERAGIAESQGDRGSAESLLNQAAAMLAAYHPGSVAANAGKARLASFLARTGRGDQAMTLYREVISGMSAGSAATGGIDRLLEPYFGLLVERLPAQPALVDDLFLASQTLVRPGVADTQAVLARSLSAGNDEAARLFRQSVSLTREIESLRVNIAQIVAVQGPTAADLAGLDGDRALLAELQTQQAATQAKLAEYPAFRAISTEALALSDLRAVLGQGEGYLKLAEVGPSMFAIYVTRDTATAWKVAMTPAEMNRRVDALRDTIAVQRNGQLITEPFDVAGARALYLALAGPMAEVLPQATRLVFEPDGAMERLPINLLVAAQGGADSYLARQKMADADPFDFRGVEWLGARVPVSVATSARAFRDIRRTRESAATTAYLGLGQNALPSKMAMLTRVNTTDGPIDCNWPTSVWGRPISAAELNAARARFGASNGEVDIGAAFTDEAVMSRADLSQFRVLHFATHGLVEAPNPACPARPALVTSFGSAESDGLLSFSEIYGLKLDADLVILSACDTAAAAGTAATREAGVTSGGNDPLDGLVRAFVGAGARSVLATHWPAPDDYKATERLVSGLFAVPPGTPTDEAVRLSQAALMNEADTSHPFYWAGFVLIGDGARPILAQR